MHLKPVLSLAMMIVSTAAWADAAQLHADATPQTQATAQTLTADQIQAQSAGIVYQKSLTNGRHLSVSRVKLPPDPATVADINKFKKGLQESKAFPPGTAVEYPVYSWLYSFAVTGGNSKPVVLWTKRADHFNDTYAVHDWGSVRVRDAAVEGKVLVLIFKQAQNTFAVVVVPDTKNGPQRLPLQGADTLLAKDDEGIVPVYMKTAQIAGSYLKRTLAVNLTFTNGKIEKFDWKNEMWVKRSTAALPADTQAERPAAN